MEDPIRSQTLANFFNINLEHEGINKLIGSPSEENPIFKIKENLFFLDKIDPSLHFLFTLAVNIIFSGGSNIAVGGTTSGAIGLVWGNPEKKWGPCDYIEYFLHELTHTLMFLDELRFSHYKDQEIMYHTENFSISAILQAARPIDRVLHSIVVATEILHLRTRNLVDHTTCKIHPSTNVIIENSLNSIEMLLLHPNKDKILTKRAFEILDRCQSCISQQMCLVS